MERVVLHVVHDAMRAEMIADFLRQHGVDADISSGTTGAFGMVGIAIPVRVPASHLSDARALLHSFESGEIALQVDDSDGPYRAKAPAPVTAPEERSRALDSPERRPFIAAAAACFVPGAGHLYVREPYAAYTIWVAWALFTVAAARMIEVAVLGPWIAIGFTAFTVRDAVRRGKARNQGVARTTAQQVVQTELSLALTAVVAAALGVAWRLLTEL